MQIDRPVSLPRAPSRRLSDFGGVARGHDLHVRDRAGDRDVLHRMMRPAMIGVDDAGAHSDDRHWQVLVAQIVAHDLERPVK